ncbi:MAG: 3-oxoacyl-ACP reductase FabG [Dehalococcoidales bacterium]|nr:3-oxoacyl-ACP reductase FabG [Dehalococcoidales bacterium]
MKLENKVAVVTGAGRGIGKAITIKLAEEGARVIINDIEIAYAENLAEKLRKTHHEAFAFKADVSNAQEVELMFAETEKRFGGVNILVNNAGIRKDIPLYKMAENDWNSAISVQVKGCFNCSRVAQNYMVTQKYGKIVNISAPVLAGLGERRQTAYSAANAAIDGFTKALAVELGPYNINVNGVAPDYIDTEMTRNAAKQEGMYLDDFRRFATAQIPLRRLGTPENIANVVLFLVSDESSFVSGQVIYARGGP